MTTRAVEQSVPGVGKTGSAGAGRAAKSRKDATDFTFMLQAQAQTADTLTTVVGQAGTTVSKPSGAADTTVTKTQTAASDADRPQSEADSAVDARDSVQSYTGKIASPEEEPDSSEETETDAALVNAEAIAAVTLEAQAQMLDAVADTLGMDAETVLSMLADNGMTAADLLTTEGLQDFVLIAAGCREEPMALATDASLLGQYRELAGVLDEVTAEASSQAQLPQEAVREAWDAAVDTANLPQVQLLTEETVATAVEPPLDANAEPDSPVAPVAEANEQPGAAAPIARDTVTVKQPVKKETQGDAPDSRGDAGTAMQRFTDIQAEGTADVVETPVLSSETRDIINQIADYIRSQVTDSVSEMDMQLHPENLGNLHIHLTSKEGMVTAHFTAENEVVKQAIENQLVQLRESFEEKGVRVDTVDVTVEEHRFDQAYNDERDTENGQAGDEAARRQRSRRRLGGINLNDPVSLAAMDLSQGEALEVEVLRQSGGTVQYRA